MIKATLPKMNFKKAIDLNPKATNARLLLASYYQSRSRFGEAEKTTTAMASKPIQKIPSHGRHSRVCTWRKTECRSGRVSKKVEA